MSEKVEKTEKHPHAGHRARMRARARQGGLGRFSDTEVLEMLLYYAVPFSDTRGIAEALLKRYGTLEELSRVKPEKISEEKGLGDAARLLFSLLNELAERGYKRKESSLLEPRLLKPFLLELFNGIELETVYALYFTPLGEYLGKRCVSHGSISSSQFKLRTVTEGSIKFGGTKVVFAHNHPSDTLVPSNDDVIATRAVATHLLANGIDLVEHYIVGKTDCVGMLEV